MNEGLDQNAETGNFEALLRHRGRLVPRFDASIDEEPSPQLDQLVLARARDALRRETPTEKHYRGPAWAVPVALAATVLLAFGLVTQLDPTRNDAVLSTAAEPPAIATPGASVATDSQAKGRARSTGHAAQPAPPPAEAPPPPAAASLPPAPSEAPQTARSAADHADVAADNRAERRVSGARRSAASQKSAADSPAGEAMATPSVAAIHDDPQSWLTAIERLRQGGDLETARSELAAFQRRYPHFNLPESLRALQSP